MSSLFAIGAVATFGMLVLLVGSVLAVSQRRNRFQIDKLEGAVGRVRTELQTEEERRAQAERVRQVQERNRRAADPYENGGT